MIERYWREMFGDFEVRTGKFEIPGFPEPLMSPHFGVRNIIGDTQVEAQLSFSLCEFKEWDSAEVIMGQAERQTLAEATESASFWQLQSTEQAESVAFLQRLLPFLCQRPYRHEHYFVRDEKGLLASVLVGHTPCASFLFNALVRSDARKRGLSKMLHLAIRSQNRGRKVFFWTKHPYLCSDAQRIVGHHVLAVPTPTMKT